MKIDRPKLHRLYRLLVNWIYPNICPCCEQFIDHDADFCEKCSAKITPYTGENDFIENVDRFAACCVYDENIEGAVLKFKKTACGNSYYAFALRIYKKLKELGLDESIDLIVPIPLTRKKFRRRGYNQTALMANELRYMLDRGFEDVLIKVKETKEQKTLSEYERRENLRGVFEISPNASDITGKRILLIDDVCTTGSTLSEAAGILKAAGAETVIAAAFAKTVKAIPHK